MGLFKRRKRKQKEEAQASEQTQLAANNNGTPDATPSTDIYQDMERKKQEQQEAKKAKEDMMSNKKRPWLCRTRFFQDMIDSSFELVDQDGSGEVDEKELYSGLLLIHLKLGTYAGPAACKPISQEKCHAVFEKMDADHSGSLDKEEFAAVMTLLFGNVMMRVAIQYACTLLIVPIIAQKLLDGLVWLGQYIYQLVINLDETYEWANLIEVSIEQTWTHATSFWSSKLPMEVKDAASTVGSTVQGWLDKVPESVWNTIPLTLLSAILSLMLIPWSLLKIDDLFQAFADRGKKKKKV